MKSIARRLSLMIVALAAPALMSAAAEMPLVAKAGTRSPLAAQTVDLGRARATLPLQVVVVFSKIVPTKSEKR